MQEIKNPQAAPMPIKIGEREFEMAPLSDRGIEAINMYIRSRILQVAQDSITENTSPVAAKATMTAAMDKAMGTNWLKDIDLIGEPEYFVQVLWTGITLANPRVDISRDDFAMLFYANIDEATKSFFNVFPVLNPDLVANPT